MRSLKFAISVITAIILLSFTAFATNVYIDGEKVAYDETTGFPFVENGKVLVPLYPTFEAFGNDGILQDNPNGTVVITKGGISVSCNTSDKNFRRNGTLIPCEYGLVWRGGPLFVPVEIFSAFDAEVNTGGSGVVITRADTSANQMGIFCASYDEAYRSSKYFGTKYEPKNGLYLGCITQGDTVEGAKKFTELFRKETAAFTVFAKVADSVSEYDEQLKYAAESGKLVRFVFDISIKEFDKEKITSLAKKLESSGARILFCPVNKKTNCEITEDDMAVFREISAIFRETAPSVAVVWQISSCHAKDFSTFYPGDTYTDYVEISMCTHDYENEKGLSSVIAGCGYKKPFIISLEFEIIANYGTVFSADYLEFCLNLPVKYPQVKAVFFPIPEDVSAYEEYINTLRSGITGLSYIESPNFVSESMPYYFELGNDVTVPPSKVKLYSVFDAGHPDVSYVIYKINGRQTDDGSVRNQPYETEVDFSSFAGKSVTLQATAYDDSNKPFSQKNYLLNVSSKQSSDTVVNFEKSIHPAVYIVIIMVGIFGIVIILKKINDIFC